ncbi:hypothetical protein [Streptomyces sp. NTK 937]|uniref:hypothetical protein n=1 Tax=Streptomyces sp. NTK 937 TaxID=1487711 RepID=UPI0004A99D8A|nr:hypothetical protein [Streptomyces sp. NTK 937]KDQ71204.1 hypothetical protein DT87_29595 [Streptomyces sp. NTK 937]
MRFTSERRLDDGVLEREFTLGEVSGILWTPASASTPAPAPLILLGHPPLGLRTMYPRLVARARDSVAEGFAAATIELPGSGDRPRWPAADQARCDLRRAMAAGRPVGDEIVGAPVLPLVDQAVPEWQAALDALLPPPGIGGPVGYSGGVISIGIRLAVVEPRVSAAVLFAGSLVPPAISSCALSVAVEAAFHSHRRCRRRIAGSRGGGLRSGRQVALTEELESGSAEPPHPGPSAASWPHSHRTRTGVPADRSPMVRAYVAHCRRRKLFGPRPPMARTAPGQRGGATSRPW